MWNSKDCLVRIAMILLIVFTALFLALSAQAASPAPSYPTDRFIVKFFDLSVCANDIITKNGKFADFLPDNSDSIDKLNKQYKVSSAEALFPGCQADRSQAIDPKHPLYNVYIFKIPQGSNIEEVIRAYSADEHVQYAQPDHNMKLAAVTGGTFVPAWNLAKINAQAAWTVSQGKDVVVAVIDTGVDFNHPDLQGHFWINVPEQQINGVDDDGNGFVDDVNGYNFVDGTSAPIDSKGHGTRVAGIIAGALNNNGAGGVAPEAKLMILKGFNSDTQQGNDSTLAQAIIYAAQNGAKIINSSWYYSSPCPINNLIQDAVKFAYQSGCLVVFAAGDNNDDIANYSPNNMKEVMAVSSSAQDDISKVASSNFGASIDVAAPGVNILAPTIGENYDISSGTSLAAAQVSGLAALIASLNPTFTNEEIRQIIRASSADVTGTGFEQNFGYGRIDAANALKITKPVAIKIARPYNNYNFDLSLPTIKLNGSAYGPGFTDYQIETRKVGSQTWDLVAGPFNVPVQDNVIAEIPTDTWSAGAYDIRAISQSGEWEFTDMTRINVLAAAPLVKQITEDDYNQTNLAISGDWAAWEDTRDVQRDIYAMNMNTKEEVRVTIDPTRQSLPSISGNIVVWSDYRSGQRDVYGFNLSTKEEFPVCINIADQRNPVVSGSNVVWEDYRNGNSDVFLYDIISKTEKQITTSGAKILRPKIDGNIIVWEDYRNGNADIYAFDLATGKESQLSSLATDDLYPDVNGNIVVWQSFVDGYWRIMMYNMTTAVTTQLSTGTTTDHNATINNTKIAWWRNDGTEHIVAYDLTSKQIINITPTTFLTRPPVADGTSIAWVEYRNNNWDIFRYKDNEPPTLNSIGDKSVVQNQKLQFSVSASDPDNDKMILSAKLQNGDAISTLAATLTDQGNGTAAFAWTPATVGQFYFVFSVTDVNGATDQKMINVTVTAPVVVPPPPPVPPEPPKTDTISKLLMPVKGSVIKSDKVTFEWEKIKNAKYYALMIGTSAGSGNLLSRSFNHERFKASTHIIPLNGKAVYVRLYTYINGKWLFNDYVFQTQKVTAKKEPEKNLKAKHLDFNQISGFLQSVSRR
ncbi:MAG: S8 family serine peptidase [Candidatus Omnitrophica bacterium]|nr:S8 family serine peptidase [Candidatus Omnitrophota bacterium]